MVRNLLDPRCPDEIETSDVDGSNDYVHVGFAYSLPKVYKVMGELGIKPPVIKKA